MKKFPLTLILIMFISGSVFAATYYVDALNGNDSSNGTSPATAWKSLSKVGSFPFVAGDRILFKKGEKFYGNFRFRRNGSVEQPIIFASYGDGEKPLLSCVKKKRLNWVSLGDNLWKTNDISTSIQRILRNDKEILQAHSLDELGKKVPDMISWFKRGNDLYLYSATNPNSDFFSYSECSQIILTVDISNLVFKDLAFKGGNTASLNLIAGSNITFQNLDLGEMAYMGIQFESKGKPSEGITIDGCNIDAHWDLNYFEAGIGFATWRGTREGVFLNGNFNNAEIKNSIFKNWHHSGINVWANPTNPNFVNNMKIINNYITSPDIPYGGKLSFAGNVRNSEIAYNTFENMYGGRMQMDGNNNHVHHNLFKNLYNATIKYGEGGGIRLGNWNRENYGHLIENNVFKNCYSNAIDVGGTNHPNNGVHDITFKNNIFDANINSSLYDSYIYIRKGATTSNLTFVNNDFVTLSSNDKIINRSGIKFTLSEFSAKSFNDGSRVSDNYSDNNYDLTVGYRKQAPVAIDSGQVASQLTSDNKNPTADTYTNADKTGPFIMDKTGLH
ncbi:hypothetical protein [Hydrogenimonas sp.]